MKPEGVVFDASWRARSSIAVVSKEEAHFMILRHYIGKWPGVCVLRLGLLVDGELKGAIIFALPPRETSKRYGGVTWELARLWIDDSLPANAETWLIGRAIRFIKINFPEVMCLVSYADPSAGHSGVIYRASNWTVDGRTDDERKTPRFDYADAATGKRYSRRSHVPEGVEIKRIPRVSKHRYFYRLRAENARSVAAQRQGQGSPALRDSASGDARAAEQLRATPWPMGASLRPRGPC